MSVLHPSVSGPWRRRSRIVLVGASALAVVAAGVTAAASPSAAPPLSAAAAATGDCPAGYTSYADYLAQEQRLQASAQGGSDELTALADAFALEKAASGESVAAGTCLNAKHPESMGELALKSLAQALPRVAPVGAVKPGAFSAGLKQRTAMKAGSVAGTTGTAKAYGTGPLVVDDPAYPEVSGLGLQDNSARVDQFSYDAASKRLFAAVGSAGIYLSTDLGLSWTSISDKMPSTITGGVGFVAKKGTRIARAVAVTGDPTFGSSAYTGFGAYYTTDLDAALAAKRQPKWAKAAGVPDGALGFSVAVDPTNSDVVYVATSLGLYRSADGGKTFVNTKLPTAAAKTGGQPCAGVSDISARPECALANIVTSVVVQTAGGTKAAKGGKVVAAVGWRGGNRANADGTIQSPSNGIYGSDTGAAGTFTKLTTGNLDSPGAFTEQDGVGRVALGAATGPKQDHGYLYALVQDARLINGGGKFIDGAPPLPIELCDPVLGACPLEGGTVLEGMYVSKDFGKTWTRLADDLAIAHDATAGSSLVGLGNAIGYEPGVQGWYNLWITPDPTKTGLNGAPTRLAFGMEEVWESDLSALPVSVPKFKVIGRYFAGESCQLLSLGLPTCPTNRDPQFTNTTHPDQHAGLFIPVDANDMSKGVTLLAGNDGGVFRQTVTPGTADDTTPADDETKSYGVTTGDFDNGHWGRGANAGFNALLPYHATMAKDGVVWAGLQDNGHMKITGPTGKRYETYGGDGFFSAVDPDNSKIAYEEYAAGDMNVTTDGGTTWTNIAPPVTGPQFSNPFVMDPNDAKHLLTAGNEVVERLDGPTGDWAQVFDLGTAAHPGTTTAATATDPNNRMTAVDVVGGHAGTATASSSTAYVGYCGTCDTLNATVPFKRGLATNVRSSGAQVGTKGTAAGWHVAAAKGLPNRYITSIAQSPADPKTVYVSMGGYTRRWTPPGTVGDVNDAVGTGHLFLSRDAGETFTDVTKNLPDAPATWVALRGPQVVVGTDVGAFASSNLGLTQAGFAPLQGLPNVPISSITRRPGSNKQVVIATNGRGVWTYTFGSSVKEAAAPKPDPVPVLSGTVVKGPFTFDSGTEGFTATTDDLLSRGWKRTTSGGRDSTAGFVFDQYGDSTTATLTSPAMTHPGGAAAVSYTYKINTEPGYDPVQLQYSRDGKAWTTVSTLNGQNANYPGYDTRKDTFTLSGAGTVYLRFVLKSDESTSWPLYDGVGIDDVTLLK